MEIDLELTEKSAKNTQRWWKLTATIVQKLDHLYDLTCSQSLFMTLLYNMYKPAKFHSGLFSEFCYKSNDLTFKILNGILPNFQGGCQMTR